MDKDSQELVDEHAYSWLEMHKKSALSYLVLEALSESPMWAGEMTTWINQKTKWGIDERGLYRVLRRLSKQGTITFESIEAERTGAERKVYRLSDEGTALLSSIRDSLSYLKL